MSKCVLGERETSWRICRPCVVRFHCPIYYEQQKQQEQTQVMR